MKNIIALGEVLLDVLPAGAKLGGAPANFAWYCHQLGLNDYVFSAVGDDDNGKRIVKELKDLGLNIKFIDVLHGEKTGTVNVTLDSASVPSYDIVQNVAWDKIPSSEEKLALAKKADVICFGSLAQRNKISRDTINAVLDAAGPECIKIFDINLRQSYFSRELLDSSLKRADILKISGEELPLAAKALGVTSNCDLFCEIILPRYKLKAIVLTLSDKGSVIFTTDNVYRSGGFKAEKIEDTVGAGDSFGAAFCAGLLKGVDFKSIGEKANKIASYVCTQKGAMARLPKDLLF